MLRRLLRLFKKTTIVVPSSADLEPGFGRTIQLGDAQAGGTEILICRQKDGSVHALNTECPHGEGGRLMPGPLIDGELAHCPLHSFHFDPKSGKVVQGMCGPARRFRVTEVDGEFHLTI